MNGPPCASLDIEVLLMNCPGILIFALFSTALAAQTGLPVPGFETFDSGLPQVITKWGVPGASIAITYQGRLVFARGYGLADRETGEFVQPESLFRIASVSKPITSAAILKLHEAGKLDLDAKVLSVLRDLSPQKGRFCDERLRQITIRQLLNHSAGWDDHSLDERVYQQIPVAAADYFDVEPPASMRLIARWAFEQFPFHFEPGTRSSYSNFGYGLLGRVVEEVGGQRYEDFVRENVLRPAGITRMWIGGNQLSDRRPGEVRYHDFEGAPMAPSIYPGEPGSMPAPYAMDLKLMDSFGGWVGSAVDVVRFSASLDGQRPPALLTPETIEKMTARPDAPWAARNQWNAMGWFVELDSSGRRIWWHDGHHMGSRALLIHFPQGISVAVLLNGCPSDRARILTDLIAVINRGLGLVRSWPATDLFPQYEGIQ